MKLTALSEATINDDIDWKRAARSAALSTGVGASAMGIGVMNPDDVQLDPLQEPEVQTTSKNLEDIEDIPTQSEPKSEPKLRLQVEPRSSGIDMDAIIQIESGGRPDAVNKRTGARGLTQIMKNTWPDIMRSLNVDWSWNEAFDPEKNLAAGSHYMNKMIPQYLKHYNLPVNYKTILASYNWGIGNVKKSVEKYGSQWTNHIPLETKNYIQKYERLIK